jgi:hypothetical protein
MIFSPRYNHLMYAGVGGNRYRSRCSRRVDTRFNIVPVAESARVHKLYSVVAPVRFLGLEVSVRRMSLAVPLYCRAVCGKSH